MASPSRSHHSAPPSAAAPSTPRVTVDHHDDTQSSATQGSRPPFAFHVSDPPMLESFASPLRHHKRSPSMPREVKETLNAHVEFTNDESDGRTHHRINQYTIMEEIGRGSYGAVHIATDQYGNEYAVKEFSKVRLRKRAQSHILRQGPHRLQGRGPVRRGAPDQPLSPQMGGLRASEEGDALYLIREEIAIMKKLHHPNVVQLIEVLDDPEEDSLYLVLEMCKKGVVMNVGLHDQLAPYNEEACRCWFRDLILGIEYLHAQGVIHRDIKPDNLLISEDDVLKVVDFGVSEMFEKSEDMRTAKSAGSPAFLPPELCAKHGDVSGKAADIWSMGVSLFCLRYGRIPFNRDGVLEMYEAIKSDEPVFADDENKNLVNLFTRILEKDPAKRIKMEELREHPWVTNEGSDVLLSAEENCSHIVEPPNELELNRAFTRKMNHLLCVMKAIHRFKALLAATRAKNGRPRPKLTLGDHSFDPATERARAEEIEHLLAQRQRVLSQSEKGAAEEEKPSIHDSFDQEPLYLGIGTGSLDDFTMDHATPDVVADSPTAVDYNVYDRAYEEAVQRHLQSKSASKPTMYLTKFVKDREHFKKLENLVEESGIPSSIRKKLPSEAQRHNIQNRLSGLDGGKLAHIVSKMGLTDGKHDEGPKSKE